MSAAHRIYAQALVAAAKDAGRLVEAREELGDFIAAVRSSRELRDLLRNPQIDRRAKRDALDAVLGEADPLLRNFVRLLADKNRIAEVEEIHEEFERLLAAEEHVLKLRLTTAVELAEEDVERVARRIEEQTARRVELEARVDPSLIGGLVLAADSHLVDASVRGRLNRLRHELAARR